MSFSAALLAMSLASLDLGVEAGAELAAGCDLLPMLTQALAPLEVTSIVVRPVHGELSALELSVDGVIQLRRSLGNSTHCGVTAALVKHIIERWMQDVRWTGDTHLSVPAFPLQHPRQPAEAVPDAGARARRGPDPSAQPKSTTPEVPPGRRTAPRVVERPLVPQPSPTPAPRPEEVDAGVEPTLLPDAGAVVSGPDHDDAGQRVTGAIAVSGGLWYGAPSRLAPAVGLSAEARVSVFRVGLSLLAPLPQTASASSQGRALGQLTVVAGRGSAHLLACVKVLPVTMCGGPDVGALVSWGSTNGTLLQQTQAAGADLALGLKARASLRLPAGFEAGLEATGHGLPTRHSYVVDGVTSITTPQWLISLGLWFGWAGDEGLGNSSHSQSAGSDSP